MVTIAERVRTAITIGNTPYSDDGSAAYYALLIPLAREITGAEHTFDEVYDDAGTIIGFDFGPIRITVRKD